MSSANVPLADVPLRSVLSERLGVPVFVDNDATVAALAEAHDEQLELVARDLVMLTSAPAWVAGSMLGGRIYRGATGGAGELGHTIIGLDIGSRRPRTCGLSPAGIARMRSRGPGARPGRPWRSRKRRPSRCSAVCTPRASRCSAPMRFRPRTTATRPPREWSRFGGAGRDRRRERDQHLRSGGGRDRRGCRACG